MKHKMALIVSGVVTAVVMVVAIGMLKMAGRFNSNTAQAASSQVVAGRATSSESADVATLQAEVATLQTQLQQAYTDLQQAYNQIQILSAANGGRGLRGGRGG